MKRLFLIGASILALTLGPAALAQTSSTTGTGSGSGTTMGTGGSNVLFYKRMLLVGNRLQRVVGTCEPALACTPERRRTCAAGALHAVVCLRLQLSGPEGQLLPISATSATNNGARCRYSVARRFASMSSKISLACSGVVLSASARSVAGTP